MSQHVIVKDYNFDYPKMYQEEEAQGEEEQENEFSQNKLNNQPAKKASVVISSGSLFDEEGRTFTFRKPGTSTENTIPKTSAMEI